MAEIQSNIEQLQAELEEARWQLRIEASTDKLRRWVSRMETSEQLLDMVSLISDEFVGLGLETIQIASCRLFPDHFLVSATKVGGDKLPFDYKEPFEGQPKEEGIRAWLKSDDPVVVFPFTPEEGAKHLEFIRTKTDYFEMDPDALGDATTTAESQGFYFIFARTSSGALTNSTWKKPSQRSLDVLVKFAGAFDLAYARFEDLQKAEVQTRAAHIETSLERVRARALEMNHSDELGNITRSFTQQLQKLGMPVHWSNILIQDPKRDTWKLWLGYSEIYPLPHLHNMTFVLDIPEPGDESLLEARERGDPFVLSHITRDALPEWMVEYKSVFDLTEQPADEILPHYPDGFYRVDALIESGIFGAGAPVPFTEEQQQIQVRFAHEFERAYRRFLELRAAEAQTRKAQIEAALERVRAKTMAMQKSDELAEVSLLLDQEVRGLGTETWGCAFNIYGPNDSTEWFGSEASIDKPYKTPREKFFLRFYEKGQAGETFYVEEFGGDKCRQHYNYMKSLPVLGDMLRSAEASGHPLPSYQVDHVAFFKYGYLLFITLEPAPEAHDIFKRFAAVFEQTYTRFLDLQQAEEQAREAQIEAAMERIRARAMAMHLSDELLEVAIELRRQIDLLGQLDLEASVVHLYSENAPTFESLAAVRPPGDDGHIVTVRALFPVDATPEIEKMVSMYLSETNEYVIEFDKEMAEAWQEVMIQHAPDIANRREGFVEGGRTSDRTEFWNFADFEGGSLLLVTHTRATDETRDLLRRSANVFNLAYRRFLDLKKAEAQAREAGIEVALERVRARALAMHASDEIPDVAEVMCEQMRLLDFPGLFRCSVTVVDSDPEYWWLYGSPGFGDTGFKGIKIPFAAHENFKRVQGSEFGAQKRHTDIYEGKSLKKFLRVLRDAGWEYAPSRQLPNRFVTNSSTYAVGLVIAVTEDPVTDEEFKIIDRFARVFDLAYQRYEDLRDIEARARENEIEASLERVRAQAMAMQNSDDIGTSILRLFKEVPTLCPDVMRLGLAVIDDSSGMNLWLAGKDSDGNETLIDGNTILRDARPEVTEMISAWEQGEAYSFKESEEFLHWARDEVYNDPNLTLIPIDPSIDQYMSAFPHARGLLFVVAEQPLSPSDKVGEVIQRFTGVFELAYQRFYDLKQAEQDYSALLLEKARTEDALSDLQATQAQLIESEKLASLGALTAGIAHEIKNPLNFVNNFAEVSSEMSQEIIEALASGDLDEAREIAAELSTNSDQIAKHGKRADSIVRSMMQHARGGASEMESIDVNPYLEEYINLAWHGMRARDDSFSADMKREFDPAVSSIQAMPQELGRVILNLLNNAFDAVRETENATVTVATRLRDNAVEISVSDNGPGIPPEIREKIFEPFFTTKATGEGTGLGLSLSYDIITKGHGGNMTITDTAEGGAQFVITLPGNTATE